MEKDRYPGLGRKRTLGSPEAVLDAVRSAWPGAGQEGSTGVERTFTVRQDGRERLVAHSWSPGSRLERIHCRIAEPDGEPVWC